MHLFTLREAVKLNSSTGLEARKVGGRSASEEMLFGLNEGSVGGIFAYAEMRSSVYERVSI